MRGTKRCQTPHSYRALYISDSKHSPESSPSLKQFTFLPWAKLCLAALFQQAEKQPCARGLLQGPLPWPRLSKTLQAQAPQQRATFQLHVSSVLNQPEKKSMAVRVQGDLEGELFRKPPEATSNSTKPKLKLLNRFPSLFVSTPLSIWEIIQPVFSITANSDSLKFSSSHLYTQPVSMPFIYTHILAVKHVFQ